MHETSDAEIQGSDSETEDNLLKYEVQSDAVDYEVSGPSVVNTLHTEDVSENNPETPESASASMPIVMPQRQTLRGKTIIVGQPVKAEQVEEYHLLILYGHQRVPLGRINALMSL